MRPQPLNEVVSLSLSLLERLSIATSNRAALGSQAMFHLQGKGIPQDLRKGRMRLLVAARSYDRLSAACLAIYYQKGKYGFKKMKERLHSGGVVLRIGYNQMLRLHIMTLVLRNPQFSVMKSGNLYAKIFGESQL